MRKGLDGRTPTLSERAFVLHSEAGLGTVVVGGQHCRQDALVRCWYIPILSWYTLTAHWNTLLTVLSSCYNSTQVCTIANGALSEIGFRN